MDKPVNVIDLFFDAVKNNPGKTAIITNGEQISFADLEKEIQLTAAYFQQKRIRHGSRVLVFVPMSIDLYRIVLALFHIGAVAVFLDEWVSKQRMEESCKVAQCDAFIGIFKARLLAVFSKELRKIPIKLGVGYKRDLHHDNKKVNVTANDTALITFTTGSTGIPKAAKRTHAILYRQFKALKEIIEPGDEDVDLCALPIVLLINLAAGCTSVIANYNPRKPEQMDAKKILSQIQVHAVTRFVASPFFVKKLAQQIISEQALLPNLQKVFTGGAPVFPVDANLFQTAFPGKKITIVYGSTEAEPISSVNAAELAAEQGYQSQQGLNTGKPHHQATVKIIQLQDGAIVCKNENELNLFCVPQGAIGEIIVSGKHVVREYLHNDEAIKQNKIFIGDDCWHRTGDSGYFSADGKLYFTGRCSVLIHHNGELLSPLLYENFFMSIDGVKMGTVVQLKNQLTAVLETEQLVAANHIAEQVNQYGIVFDGIKFVKKMPRDPRHHSKIDYAKLLQELQ